MTKISRKNRSIATWSTLRAGICFWDSYKSVWLCSWIIYQVRQFFIVLIYLSRFIWIICIFTYFILVEMNEYLYLSCAAILVMVNKAMKKYYIYLMVYHLLTISWVYPLKWRISIYSHLLRSLFQHDFSILSIAISSHFIFSTGPCILKRNSLH